MNVLVIGANGQIGKQIVRELALEKGFFVRAMIRKASQMDELEKLGGKPIIADLEKDFSYAYDEIDAVIFAAGSGGHTGPEKTISVDQDGAIKAIQFAEEKNIKRFILISSILAGEPEKGPASLANYLTAKGHADNALLASQLDFTILRPVTLTNDSPTGLVDDASEFGQATITRADVAQFACAILSEATTYRKIYTFQNGQTPISNYIH
ncbi:MULTISPECIES: SDR family oxidoreductase [Listeria]|uniref:SDR family oxidoreductase n=1 Tax=Listeria TaxID=1637 RepID=UPI000B5889D8|nr:MULTISPECIES: SDR family oxidoreductase [Listeria]